MIAGYLLKSPDGDLCLASLDEAQRRVTAVRYMRDKNLVSVVFGGGGEETLISAPDPVYREALSSRPDILVAHVSDLGALREEYRVALKQG